MVSAGDDTSHDKFVPAMGQTQNKHRQGKNTARTVIVRILTTNAPSMFHVCACISSFPGVSWNYFADTRLQLGADLTQLDSKRTKVTLVKSTRKVSCCRAFSGSCASAR
jgi:hypothetical protein